MCYNLLIQKISRRNYHACGCNCVIGHVLGDGNGGNVMGAWFWNRAVSRERFINMCRDGDIQGVIKAIKAGTDVNTRNSFGTTPLMSTVARGRAGTAGLLIKAGAEINAKSNQGITALMLAAYNGYTETAEALIQAGADVNAKNNEGKTALHLARKNDELKGTDALRRLEALLR